jgi:hypothetical protein
MSLATAIVPSPLRTDETGAIRIGSSRVPLEGIVHAFDAGSSAEEIVKSRIDPSPIWRSPPGAV